MHRRDEQSRIWIVETPLFNKSVENRHFWIGFVEGHGKFELHEHRGHNQVEHDVGGGDDVETEIERREGGASTVVRRA